jgi:hypothetical protein
MPDCGEDLNLPLEELLQDGLERRRGRALVVAVKAPQALGGNLAKHGMAWNNQKNTGYVFWPCDHLTV